MDSQPNILYYLSKEAGVVLPTDLFKSEILEKLNKAFCSGNPIIVSEVYRELSEDVEKYLQIEKLTYVFELGEFLEGKVTLSEDDEKIIEFLIQTPHCEPRDILQIVSPLYFVSNVIKEFEEFKRKNLRFDNLKVHTALSQFLQLYEVLTLIVDKRVYIHLKRKPLEEKDVQKFLNIQRDRGKHATVGQVNKILSLILNLGKYNTSIFGINSGCRKIRNNFAHANLSYDSHTKVIIAENEELSIEDFLLECSLLFMFGLRWLKRSIAHEYGSTDYVNTLVKEIRKLCVLYSREFLRIDRNSRCRNEFHTLVSQWKKKALNSQKIIS